jgi:hypothetical protein
MFPWSNSIAMHSSLSARQSKKVVAISSFFAMIFEEFTPTDTFALSVGDNNDAARNTCDGASQVQFTQAPVCSTAKKRLAMTG